MSGKKAPKSMGQFAAEGLEKVSASADRLVSELLPLLARKGATRKFPVQAGSSFFYELPQGWEGKVLLSDDNVSVVRTTDELEKAFLDVSAATIFVPAESSITKNIAVRVCKRHGQGKTVFFEVKDNE